MTIEAVENAPSFAKTWVSQQPPYTLPNGETIDEKPPPYLTIKGQETSLQSNSENIVPLIRSPTREVLIGFELFFIFEKTGIFTWQFRTIDIDGTEEIHTHGRYSSVKNTAQAYLNKYKAFDKSVETCIR